MEREVRIILCFFLLASFNLFLKIFIVIFIFTFNFFKNPLFQFLHFKFPFFPYIFSFLFPFVCPCVRVFSEDKSPSIPEWLRTERREAFEGHLNAYEVSLLCREAEDSVYPYLYEAGGGGNHTMDDDINQNTQQYLQVKISIKNILFLYLFIYLLTYIFFHCIHLNIFLSIY